MEEKYDLVVIGAGPGGYVASLRAARWGLKVACIDRRPRPGGTCLHVGCIPSKALLDSSEYYQVAKKRLAEHGVRIGGIELDLPAMMERKNKVVEGLSSGIEALFQKHGIRWKPGSCRIAGPGEVVVAGPEEETRIVKADSILVATGSEPVLPSGLGYDGKYVVSSTEALSFQEVPGHLVVIGAGSIGLELGSVWLRLGARVTVVEMMPRLAPGLDRQVGKKLEKILQRQGFEFRYETRVVETKVTDGKVDVVLEKEGQKEVVSCDRVLIAIGRRPSHRGLGIQEAGVKVDANGQIEVEENYRTEVPSIFAIGDVIAGPMLAHRASAEGNAVADFLAKRPGEVNYDCIPSIVYTFPEVACVGLTEEQLIERNIPYRSATHPCSAIARARCLGEHEGMVKILAHKRSDRVLGVHIVAPRASEMISECVLGMEFGCSSEDIARVIHGHPTFSEGLQEAAASLFF